MTLTPDTNIQYLKGVGEKRAALYRKLGIATVRDLLRHYPRDYIDLSAPYLVMEAPLHEMCAVKAVLTHKSAEKHIRKGLSVFKLMAADHSGALELTVFNSKYTIDKLELGASYCFYGKISGGLPRREMSAPQIYPAQSPGADILPVYPQTAGLTSKMIRTNINESINRLNHSSPTQGAVNIPDSPIGAFQSLNAMTSPAIGR